MKLASVFSDHMVLQRDVETSIFGESYYYEQIVVNIEDENGYEDTLLVDNVKPGKWCLKMNAHPAGGPFTLKAYSQVLERTPNGNLIPAEYGIDKEFIFEDVYFGEVWLNNGQSNIEFELQNAIGGPEEIASNDYPLIRYYNVIKAPVIDEEFLLAEEEQKWKICNKGEYGDISAIGYYYAVELHKKLGVPVGIVDCYLGGTSVTCWLQESILQDMPEGREYIKEFKYAIWNKSDEQFEEEQREYQLKVDEFMEKEKAARAVNPNLTNEELDEIAGSYPWPPPVGRNSAYRPAGLIETMFKRVAPYTVKGIVYYQGEEDAIHNYEDLKKRLPADTENGIEDFTMVLTHEQADSDYLSDEDVVTFTDIACNTMYRNLLFSLIEQYRCIYSEFDLPIVLIQLPMYIMRKTEDMRDWAYIRDAQEKIADHVDNVFLVPLTDCGDYDEIHPTDKATPGHRVADTMLKNIYGGSPVRSYLKVAGCSYDNGNVNTVRVTFDNNFYGVELGENSLIDFRKETPSVRFFPIGEDGMDDDYIYGFEILVDGEWKLPVGARIDGEDIVLMSGGGSPISGVRYGFFNYGKVNVYNKIGMPLVQFKKPV